MSMSTTTTPVPPPPFSPDEILAMDAYTLSQHLQGNNNVKQHTPQRIITCLQLMEATLERIELVNPQCNAIICLQDKQQLLQQAQEADRSLGKKGWLHGIPMAIKDISHAQGFPTTMGGGSTLLQDEEADEEAVATFNDIYVEHLRNAGAIIIGKTNTPENGLGSHTFNDRWGTTTNPLNPSKSAGGSSGGAAVAVTTRMLCVADGTDMMGSLRNPAGWNLLYSHRPTAGIIKEAAVLPSSGSSSSINTSSKNPLSYPISTPGPMARTPLDVALLLETMVDDQEIFNARPMLDNININTKSISNVRIGWLGDWGGAYPFEDGILSLCQSALQVLKENDIATVVEDLSASGNGTLPIFPADLLWTNWNRIRFAMMSSKYTQAFDEKTLLLGDNNKNKNNSPMKPDLQWEIAQGRQVTAEDLEQAGQVAKDYHACLDTIFETYDVLALPSAQVWPFPAEWTWPKYIGDKEMDTYHRWMEVCIPVSFGGLPCTTVPAGVGPTGLPMGLTLFGKRGDDLKLLQLANEYHKLTDVPSKVKWTGNTDSITTLCT
jgi:amidase